MIHPYQIRNQFYDKITSGGFLFELVFWYKKKVQGRPLIGVRMVMNIPLFGIL